MKPSKLNNLLVFSLVWILFLIKYEKNFKLQICFLETISVNKYSRYCQNMPVLGLAVLVDGVVLRITSL
jgi:hypothetical protein